MKKYYKILMQQELDSEYKIMSENITIYENREFMIFNVSELPLVDFTKVHETSADTVRKSIDDTKTFCKWDGPMPDFFNSMTTKEGSYTYTEILNILSTSEWTNPNI